LLHENAAVMSGPTLVGSYDYVLVGALGRHCDPGGLCGPRPFPHVTAARGGLASLARWRSHCHGIRHLVHAHIGMLAFRLPVPVQLRLANRRLVARRSHRRLRHCARGGQPTQDGCETGIAGGVLMGGGIATMHYTGMERCECRRCAATHRTGRAVGVACGCDFTRGPVAHVSLPQRCQDLELAKVGERRGDGLAIPVMHYTAWPR